MSINKNFSATFFFQILVIVFNFITGVFITRIIGADGRAVFALFTTDTQLLIFFLGLSLTEGIIYHNGNKFIPAAKILGLVIFLLLVIAIVGFIFIATVTFTQLEKFFYPSGYALIIFFGLRVYITFIGLIITNICSGFLVSYKLFRHLGVGQLLNAIVSLGVFAVTFLLANRGFAIDVETILNVHVILTIFSTLVFVVIFYQKLNILPDFSVTFQDHFKPFITYIFTTSIAVLINFINYRIDLYYLNRSVDLQSLGIYALAVMLSQLLWLISNNLVTVLMPYLTEATAVERIRILDTYCKVNSSFLIVASLIGVSCSAQLIPFVYGKDFSDSAFLFNILIIGSVFCGLTKTYGNYLASINYFRFNLYSNLAGAILNIILCSILIPRFGVLGAAFCSTTSYLVMYVITLQFVERTGYAGIGLGLKNLFINSADLKVLLDHIKRKWKFR